MQHDLYSPGSPSVDEADMSIRSSEQLIASLISGMCSNIINLPLQHILQSRRARLYRQIDFDIPHS